MGAHTMHVTLSPDKRDQSYAVSLSCLPSKLDLEMFIFGLQAPVSLVLCLSQVIRLNTSVECKSCAVLQCWVERQGEAWADLS